MLSAALDSNVIVAGLLSQWHVGASMRVLHEFRLGEFKLIHSRETLSELREVLGFSTALRKKYKWTDLDLDNFCANLASASNVVVQQKTVSHACTRDITDTKFLNLALSANADYLVTNDRRHILPLKKIGCTQIVTPHKFLLALKRERDLKMKVV